MKTTNMQLNFDYLVSYLEQKDFVFISQLKKENQLNTFFNECNQKAENDFIDYINQLNKDFILSDEAENNYFESLKSEFLLIAIEKTKPYFL
jgi:hypothetical protein